MLQESVDSAAAQLPDEAELIILPNGPAAIESAGRIDVPERARIVASHAVLDIVTNWNRCLEQASGELIHLLHEDDAVAPGFYRTILELAREFPSAALYATSSTSFATSGKLRGREGQPQLLQGLDAARFLLDDDRHSCGNVVITRRVVDRLGGFSAEFAYCLDEEAYPRWAADGGLGFHPAPLYRNRKHSRQGRYPDWLRDEFVETYVRSRVEGSRELGDAAVELAWRSSERRVVSVAVTLALAGYRSESREELTDLETVLRPRRSWRAKLAKTACRSRLLLEVAQLRRRSRAALRH
jgi:hypothetical protein